MVGIETLVSVIVNVYNCREYLPTSLESIRQQTYRNLEVILVDDASTDGSGQFCDEFCKQDVRFCTIHLEKNTGVSGPRNAGLRVAKGEYIYFMDSDDYIHERAIEILVEAIEKTGLSLAVFDFYYSNSLTEDTHCKLKGRNPVGIPKDQVVFEMLSRVDLKWCVVWNKLYKRSLIDDLFFNDYYCIQDQDFNIRIYMKVESVAFIPERMYWYYSNPNSLQRLSSLIPKKLYFNTMYRFKMLEYLSRKGKEKQYRAWVIDYGYRQMLQRRDMEKGTEYEGPFSEVSYEILRDTLCEFILSRHIQFVKKIRFFFFWYFPHIAKAYLRLRAIVMNTH